LIHRFFFSSAAKLATLAPLFITWQDKMKRVVLYIKDKCPHCKDAQRYLDSKGIQYRLCNAKMHRGRKELDAIGARSVPVLKIGDRLMIGWNPKNFERMYGDK
jgi:glutaredoxin